MFSFRNFSIASKGEFWAVSLKFQPAKWGGRVMGGEEGEGDWGEEGEGVWEGGGRRRG